MISVEFSVIRAKVLFLKKMYFSCPLHKYDARFLIMTSKI